MDSSQLYEEALTYYDNSEFKEAIEKWSLIDIEDEKYGEAQNGIATAYNQMGEYDKAIEYVKNIINTQSEELQSKAYGTLGNIHFVKKEYSLAKSAYEQSLLINNNNPEILYNIGLIFAIWESYDTAICYYDKALLNKKKANQPIKFLFSLYHNLGIAEVYTGHYFEAIEASEKALEYKENISTETIAMVYLNIGIAYTYLKSFDKAIEFSKKALSNNPQLAEAYHNLGVIYCLMGVHGRENKKLSYFEQSISNSEKALKILPDMQKAYKNMIVCYLYIGDERKFSEIYTQSNLNEYTIIEEITLFLKLSKISKTEKINSILSKFLKPALNSKACFYKYIIDQIKLNESKVDEDIYLNIYYKMIEIINMLHIRQGYNDDSENYVAHYTRKNIAENLLFSKSPFRLNTILTGNDPKEGITLLDSLGIGNDYDSDFSYSYQAFIGCFTFNHECLNQFRLYGKEEHKEATGVSIVVDHSFFSQDPYSNISLPPSILDASKNKFISDQSDIQKKLPLYRCIYLDPETKMIASVGCREYYTFYREQNCKIKRDEADIKASQYSKKINMLLSDLRSKFYSFQRYVNGRINKKEVSESKIRELLLPIRLLIKHVAFKEEQECRILRIEFLNINSNIKPIRKEDGINIENYESMYIDYESDIKDSAVKVFFAPKTQGFHLFRDNVQTHNLYIKCQKSKHPFNNK